MGEAFVVILVAGSENAIALDQGIPGLEHVLRAPVGRQKPAAPVDNQDAEGELVDRGLKQATIRARRRQLVMQRGCTAQVTIQRRGETSDFVAVEGSCLGAAQHADDGIGVPRRRFEDAALDAVETTDPQQEVVEVLVPLYECSVKIVLDGDPLSDLSVLKKLAIWGNRAIVGAVESFPAAVWMRAGEEIGFVLATVPDHEVSVHRACRIGQCGESLWPRLGYSGSLVEKPANALDRLLVHGGAWAARRSGGQ